MAILAFIRSIREIQIGVAVAACHGGVTPTERKSCLGMIKPDLVRDNLPIHSGVTRPARNIEFAVRTLGRRHRRCRLPGRSAYR